MESLDRFVAAQDGVYPKARREVIAGHKASHWIWFIYPQLRGLGRSEMSHRYGIADLSEAEAYLAHPVLGPRIVEMFEILIEHHRSMDPADIFGDLDAQKVRSSATLFARAEGAPEIFERVLDIFYDGPCPATTRRL
ncbi:DUF1810 domain-containing protein [Palleronia sp. LCG004]|uniref:DUF1810 domain-containing protein n=1 Tax=Palleronia sp. LCG004 TaxID=3079304 RepID=UPI0029427975|nr:DUF1810 domain-containing protein [Palleronia sp. LCG004]WOI55400.1 DUF1810 domain-containing protein [Palleronia sp. LCG004]